MKEDPQESVGRALRRLSRATQALKRKRTDTAQLDAAHVLITDWLKHQNRELGPVHRRCSICQRDHGYDGEMKDYPGVVCQNCDKWSVDPNVCSVFCDHSIAGEKSWQESVQTVILNVHLTLLRYAQTRT